MANFSDFVRDSSKDKNLGNKLISQLKTSTPEDLQKLFTDAGYDVSISDCKNILDHKDSISEAYGTVQPLY